MGYEVTDVSYLEGKLFITGMQAEHAISMLGHGYHVPEVSFLDEIDLNKGRQEIRRPSWAGVGSNNTDALVEVLKLTRGHADLLVVWEGGSEMWGYRVENGIVSRRKVVITLTEDEA